VRTAFNTEEKCLVDDYEPETLKKKLKESEDYVSNAKFMLMYNFEQFDARNYGKNRIKKVSRI